MAKFPKPQNEEDAWHGYPVFSSQTNNCPSDELLDLWEKNNELPEVYRLKIEKRKL